MAVQLHFGFTIVALISLIFMLAFVYFRSRFVGAVAWFLFGIAWLFNLPHYLSIGDYYNTFIMVSAFAVFTWMSLAVVKTDRLEVFIDTTAFSILSIAVYFIFAFTYLGYFLMVEVAKQSAFIGRLFGFNMVAVGRKIYMDGKHVTLILACTGIQSIALFTGVTLGIRANIKRKIKAFLVSVPVIYFLNLLRDAFVCASYARSWFGKNSFYIAHNVISKILATIALVLIAYAVFKILPELEELIWSLMDEMRKTIHR
ncbi:MAG: archaeosortase A [Archaeoglobus sp.]|jgi:archaeosortase A (PGF-CTERM-specific)|nr:MAG: archaeosortase A [Archaeoglobus sp.]